MRDWERKKIKRRKQTNKQTKPPQKIWAETEIQKYWLNRKKSWSCTKMCFKQGCVIQNSKEIKLGWRDRHRYEIPTTVYALTGNKHFKAISYVTAMPRPCLTHHKQHIGTRRQYCMCAPFWLTSCSTPRTCFRSAFNQFRNFKPC